MIDVSVLLKIFALNGLSITLLSEITIKKDPLAAVRVYRVATIRCPLDGKMQLK